MEPIALEKLTLRNVRGIPELEVDFAPPEPGRGQWTVLLGENGAGKTTILQSLATLTGHNHSFDVLRLRREGTHKGEARLQRPSAAKRRFETSPDHTGWSSNFEGGETTFGYGARRGGALGGSDRAVDFSGLTDHIFGPNVVNHAPSLFDPNARLIHAETWLRSREHAALKSGGGAPQAFFESVVQTVLSLLPGVDHLDVRTDDVLVSGPGVGTCRLEDLADGYLTTLGWTLDFIARWAHVHRDQIDGDFRDQMVALVLVDEIDLHLHPRWQRSILQQIRDTFPVTSFVVTTHNPLTIQGARPGEVQVLQRDADGNVSCRQVDPPLGADVDDLLTGPWFGLSTTYDGDTVDKLEAHADLLRQGVPRQDPRRQHLESTLRDRLQVFADTEEDRRLLEKAAQTGLSGLAGKLSRLRAAKK